MRILKRGINPNKYKVSNLGQQIDLVVTGHDSSLDLTLPAKGRDCSVVPLVR